MRVQPRQQLLEIWRAVARGSVSERSWIWGGGTGRSSIADAEHLLCLLTPATEVDTLKLDQPDETAEDVLAALRPMGDSVELPRRLVRVLREYLTAYTDQTGAPVFPGGGYFGSVDPTREPTEAQRGIEVVDSYSVSVRLSLAAAGFARTFRQVVTREDLRGELTEVERLAQTRLTAAMIGLLRSYATNVFDADSVPGTALVRSLNQRNQPPRRIVEDLRHQLREVIAGLRDLTIGTSQEVDLENPNRLFECGWSWAPVRGAPAVETNAPGIGQIEGIAQPAPYLYFTAGALDSIQDLFSERTRILGLLDDEQLRLARALQVRWDLTQSYWATIATFGGGGGRWPLEDIPWRTTDEAESDYLTLLVSAITLQSFADRSATDAELGRVGDVLADLASRARITRRPTTEDPAVALHAPGLMVELVGSEIADAPRLSWMLSDFSPQLLRRAVQAASLIGTAEPRGHVLDLADRIWDHLEQRRHRDGRAGRLWDQPGQIYDGVKVAPDTLSWYYTERVVQGLVSVAKLVASSPLRSARLEEIAASLLSEAEHLFDQELLMVSAEAGPAMGAALQTARVALRRSRAVIADRPGTALSLAAGVLRDLDRLASARTNLPEGS